MRLVKALIVSALSPTNIRSLAVNILDNNTTACSFSHRWYQLSVLDTDVISLLKSDPIMAWTIAAILAMTKDDKSCNEVSDP
jgi:hypothetical protein